MTVAIIDYGMGNLRSVQKAFEKTGTEAVITNDPAVVAAAPRVVLPGVGAFGDAMAELKRRDLIGVIRDVAQSDRPFLGICLGMQLLFEVGYEEGEHEGLGLFPGAVRRFDLPPTYKVPHMGWNTVEVATPHAVTAGLSGPTHFYFVHSYYCDPADPSLTTLVCDYGGPFTAAVGRDNLFATQFHPEKSQSDGLALIAAFAGKPLPAATV